MTGKTALRLCEIGIGCGCQSNGAIDFAGRYFLPGFQPRIEIAENAVGLIARMRLPGDDERIAAQRGKHIEALLDASKVAIIRTEKLRQQTVVIKGNDETVAICLFLYAIRATRCAQLRPVLSMRVACIRRESVPPDEGDLAENCDSLPRSLHPRSRQRGFRAHLRREPIAARGCARQAGARPCRDGRTVPSCSYPHRRG